MYLYIQCTYIYTFMYIYTSYREILNVYYSSNGVFLHYRYLISVQHLILHSVLVIIQYSSKCLPVDSLVEL